MMRQRVWITLMAVLWILLVGTVSSSFAGEGDTEVIPVAVTTADPDVLVEELVLMLKPLTKKELLVEADAWQALLKAKVIEISKAEIVVKRQNREIEKSKEIQEKAEEAKEQLEEVKKKVEEVKVSGDANKIQETEEAAREAQEMMREIKDSVEEAAVTEEKTAEAKERLAAETKEGLNETAVAADEAQDALGRVQEAVEEMDNRGSESARKAREATAEAEQAIAETRDRSKEAVQRLEENDPKAVAIDETAAAMERAEEAKKGEKVELLENVNKLREERTMAIDRLKSVLEELETKTDEGDAKTLAKIKDYHLYIGSVRGIQVDVKDTTSAWIAVKGWLTSQEGGFRWAKNVAVFIGIIFIAWLLSKILSRAVHRGLGMMENVSQLLDDFLVGMVRWLVMIVGIIMALAALEVSIGPLLAIVGAAGFVIAFALQDSLSNFASGIMILLFQPFDVGDVVEAGGVSGKVISMNLVATTIKTLDNKDMVVPNE
ncbi:MAG: mechanosensitive ion channel domain-containing protein [Pseudomonadota bacterium]